MDKITLRNTISGVSYAYDADYARMLLDDPKFGQFHVVVDTDKPEVLSQPYTVEDGERKPVEEKTAEPERVTRTAKGGPTVRPVTKD